MAQHGSTRTSFGVYSKDDYGKCRNDSKHRRVPLGYYLAYDSELVLPMESVSARSGAKCAWIARLSASTPVLQKVTFRLPAACQNPPGWPPAPRRVLIKIPHPGHRLRRGRQPRTSPYRRMPAQPVSNTVPGSMSRYAWDAMPSPFIRIWLSDLPLSINTTA